MTERRLPPISHTPLVSVILTSYNYAEYVSEAIESVLTQSYPHIQLIVVDDGSTDGSAEIVRQVVSRTTSHVRTIFKENEGQASALNKGFELAEGEVICLLDSDDLWYPRKVETMVHFMRDCPGGALYQHQMDTAFGIKELILPSGDLFLNWRRYGKLLDVRRVPLGPFIPTSGLVFPSVVLRKVFPIPAELRTCPDGFLTRTSCAYGPVFSWPMTLGLWREHGRNAGKQPEFSRDAFWIPMLMPALNRYYAAHDIPIRLFDGSAPILRLRRKNKWRWRATYEKIVFKCRRFLSHQHNVIRDAGKVVLQKLLPTGLYLRVYETLRRKNGGPDGEGQ